MLWLVCSYALSTILRLIFLRRNSFYRIASWKNRFSFEIGRTKNCGWELYTSVSQPPGLEGFFTGTCNILQTLKFTRFIKNLRSNFIFNPKDALILLEFKRYFYIFEETRVKLQNRGRRVSQKNFHRDLSLLILLPTGTWSPKGWETLLYTTLQSFGQQL